MIKRKFLIAAAALLMLIPIAVFSETAYDFSELGKSIVPYVQLDIMCSLDSFLEQDEIPKMQSFSAELDPFYKNLLYDKYAQEPWGVATANFFTGGMGSLVNGNILSGSILQAGFVGSYTFMVIGLVEADPEKRSTDFLIAEIGAVVFGIAGLVLPFIEISNFNDALKKSLNL